MAKKVMLEWKNFSCCLCMNLLKTPVTAPCGHSFCSECIRGHWDAEEEKRLYGCPQCGISFTPRPVLEKSTMLAALVEALEKTRSQAASNNHCYAGVEDVACDVCTEGKLKAVKSCLDCRVSYCGFHLEPHHQSSAFQIHKLVEPTLDLQEDICTSHDELRKMFCRTDDQNFCVHCFFDETVACAAPFALGLQRSQERQRKIIQQLIQDRKEDLKVLQMELKVINDSADKAMKNNEHIFTQMICLLEQRRSEMQQQVTSRQEAEVSRLKELQKKLELKITELRRRDAWLEKLSCIQDFLEFTNLTSSYMRGFWHIDSDTPGMKVTLGHFDDVTGAVSELRDKIQEFLMDTQMDSSRKVPKMDVFEPELSSREDFLMHAHPLTLDPNTANRHLVLSEDNRKVTHVKEEQPYPDHPDRFERPMVMIRECLTGKCYLELELGCRAFVQVSDRDIPRTKGKVGVNDTSWVLFRFSNGYIIGHNNKPTRLYLPVSSRVGVYLDHSKGLLSFYAVCGTMELIYTVPTTFTEPLYVALTVEDCSAELCDIWLNSEF